MDLLGVHHLLLDAFDASDHLGIVLELLREQSEVAADSLAHIVVLVVLDLGGPLNDGHIDLVACHAAGKTRQPGGHLFIDELDDGILHGQYFAMGPVDEVVDKRLCFAIGDVALEQTPDRRTPFGLHHAVEDLGADEFLGLGVVKAVDGAGGHFCGLVRGELRIARLGQPGAGLLRDVVLRDLRRERIRGEELFLYEGTQCLAYLVLLPGNQRGVRDRDAHGVAEDGGNREPVRETADHASLGARAHIAHPRRGVGVVVLPPGAREEDDCGEDKQAGDAPLVLAQGAAALGDVGWVGAWDGDGHWYSLVEPRD
ncbi:hypothetical protein AZH45_03180 [Corynebacterium striatum]|nr:hypothetical protein AZH45_03180 [Corynebacterium striatum]